MYFPLHLPDGTRYSNAEVFIGGGLSFVQISCSSPLIVTTSEPNHNHKMHPLLCSGGYFLVITRQG